MMRGQHGVGSHLSGIPRTSRADASRASQSSLVPVQSTGSLVPPPCGSDNVKVEPILSRGPSAREGVTPRVARQALKVLATRPAERRGQLRQHREKKFGHLKGSVLKLKSVSNATAARYEALLMTFDEWVRRVYHLVGADLTPGELMDEVLASFFEELFWDGGACHQATATFAAAGWRAPGMSRHGAVPMPRCRQAMAAFSKLDPSKSRMPLPPGVMAMYVEWFRRQDFFWAAVGVALATCLYLRPKELCDLQWSQVHPPCSHVDVVNWSVLLHPDEWMISSKTGRFNDTIEVDGVLGMFLSDALREGKRCYSPRAPVIQMPQEKFTRLFARAGRDMNLTALGPPVLYQLRHTGASRDLMGGHRSLKEVKRRGRWFSDKSVQRYTKGGRLPEQMAKLSRTVARAAQSAWSNLNVTLSPPSRCWAGCKS